MQMHLPPEHTRLKMKGTILKQKTLCNSQSWKTPTSDNRNSSELIVPFFAKYWLTIISISKYNNCILCKILVVKNKDFHCIRKGDNNSD